MLFRSRKADDLKKAKPWDGFEGEQDDEDDEPSNVYIANGEIGRVVALLRSKDGKKVTGMLCRFCGRLVKVGKDALSDFDLAYAVTCHKFQGAQSPVVIVIADEGANQVASRAWWYTALTRAGRLCVTIGKRGTILAQCQRVDLQNRKTFLREGLQEWGSRRERRDAVSDEWLESL